MKRAWTLLLLASLYMNCLAGPVTPQKARQTACEFFSKKGKQLAIKNETMPQASYYIFNAEGGKGFVIVAGNDADGELLGYADNGTLDENHMPDNMREWLNAMTANYSQTHGKVERPRRIPNLEAISPILSSRWGQGVKNETGNAYNMLSPVVDGNYCPAGCVAVAMAQVMRHHRWPQEACDIIPGYDNIGAEVKLDTLPQLDFDWDNMLDYYEGGEDEEAQLAVAQLIRYCGQGALTAYYSDRAEAYAKNAVNAFVNYFGYAPSVRNISKEDYDEEEWNRLIYCELSCNRPVIYFGSTETSSHAFICDGYDGEEFYHINWGWGGVCDGYFKLSNLAPDGDENDETGKDYSKQQHAIVGITPNAHSGNNLVFDDPAVEEICISHWDTDGDGELSVNEAANVLSLRNAFRNDTTITSFEELRYFTGLRGLSNGAFEGCTHLGIITIPENVQSVDINVFHLCPALSQITVVEENTIFDSREDCNAIIETATSTLVAGCSQTIIPQSVTALGDHVFEDCTDLSEIELPEELVSIGDYCFAGCTGMEDIILPTTLTFIGEKAFAGCTNLATIFIDQPNPPTAAPDAFEEVSAIVHVPSGAREAYSNAEGWCELIIEEPQADNYIYCDDIVYRKPLGATLDIGLRNKDVTIGLQFQMTLPEGISISTNSRGMPLLETTDRTAGHTVHCTKQEDNSYIVLLMSMTLEEIAENNGIILSIPLEANDSVPEGEYEVRFDNISISTMDDNEDIYGAYPAPFTSKLTYKYFLPGDVNHDRHIDVSDVMMTVYHSLSKYVTPFFKDEADIDENNRIDIVDVMRIVQIVIRRPSDAYAPSNIGGSAMLEADGEGSHTLHIDDPSRFTAMQFCVQPGKGSKVTGIHLDEAYEGRYQMSYAPAEDGDYNVVVYSIDGRAFTNGSTAMVHIDTEGDESEVAVSKILLVTSDLQTVGAGNVTRITPNYATTDEDTPAYNLAGQRVAQGYKGLVIKKGKALITR
ncbi:MAG: C10 family peptidase [Prevotella sp.]|nr:C10 family peptidase [Prevotella sp.]